MGTLALAVHGIHSEDAVMATFVSNMCVVHSNKFWDSLRSKITLNFGILRGLCAAKIAGSSQPLAHSTTPLFCVRPRRLLLSASALQHNRYASICSRTACYAAFLIIFHRLLWPWPFRSRFARGRPILLLEAGAKGSNKGLTNQLSLSVNALYLAAELNWDVVLPHVYSPVLCSNQNTDCYQYNKFKSVPFGKIYDYRIFIKYCTHKGIRVYKKVPRSYLPLPDSEWPCKRYGRCFDSASHMVKSFKHIRGRFVVRAPGIGAIIPDTLKSVSRLRHASLAFRHSNSVRAKAQDILAHVRSENNTILAVHYRFEPDAMKVNYAGDEQGFVNSLTEQTMQLLAMNANVVLYFSTGYSIAELSSRDHIGLLRRQLPEVQFFDKYATGSVASKITFEDAAIDFEVALEADVFVGTSRSSFAAFIALQRSLLEPHKETVLLPSVNRSTLCQGRDSLGNWMFELTVPYNRCRPRDACRLQHSKAYKVPILSPTCDCSECLEFTGSEHCTGMTKALMSCQDETSAISVIAA